MRWVVGTGRTVGTAPARTEEATGRGRTWAVWQTAGPHFPLILGGDVMELHEIRAKEFSIEITMTASFTEHDIKRIRETIDSLQPNGAARAVLDNIATAGEARLFGVIHATI